MYPDRDNLNLQLATL